MSGTRNEQEQEQEAPAIHNSDPPCKKNAFLASEKGDAIPVPSHNEGSTRVTNHFTKKRVQKQPTYMPDVPMSKEELAAWRKEARRERNRASAAASRQRIRDRIKYLENEVEALKAKYEATMEKVHNLEMAGARALPAEDDCRHDAAAASPAVSAYACQGTAYVLHDTDVMQGAFLLCASPPHSSPEIPSACPSSLLPPPSTSPPHPNQTEESTQSFDKENQQAAEKTSRPPA